MNTRHLVWAGLAVFVLLSLIPLAGFARAFPIPDGSGGIRPLGSWLPGTPLYTTEIVDGDLSSYLTWAAQRAHEGANVYDGAPRRYDVDIFPYPPALLFVGFALLPLEPYHYYAWLPLALAAMACIAWCVNALLREKGIARNVRIAAVCLVFLSQGIIRNLGWGHYYLFVVALLFGVAWWAPRSEWIAGALAGILNAILLYGLVLAPYFLITRRYKALALSLLIPIVPLAALALVSPPSFWGFFPFVVGVGAQGAAKGFFSVTHVLPGGWKLAWLALNALLWCFATALFWRHARGGKTGPSEKQYVAFLILFILMTEPWLSGHHTITALVAYALIATPWMLVPFALTELNYQTLFGMGKVFGYVAYTYPMFLGVALAYGYVLWGMWRQASARGAKRRGGR